MILVPGLPVFCIRLGPSPLSSLPFAGFPPTPSNGAALALILPFPCPMQRMERRLAPSSSAVRQCPFSSGQDFPRYLPIWPVYACTSLSLSHALACPSDDCKMHTAY